MKVRGFFIGLFLLGIVPLTGMAEAPVIDDSENFAILDEQQQEPEQAIAQDSFNDNDSSSPSEESSEVPLAKEVSDKKIQSNPQLLSKLQALQQEVQELRGQLEVQGHDLKMLQQQQLAFYKDLDNRLRGFASPANKTALTPTSTVDIANTTTPTHHPTATVNKPVSASSSGPLQSPALKKKASSKAITMGNTNPADEQISYLAAYDLVKTKQFDAAIEAMQLFSKKYPQGSYTANAQYWLGELYMAKKNYVNAIKHFTIVLDSFPTSNKAAASSLKLGYAFAASGKTQDAKQALQQVIKNYPNTTTAQLARAKLVSLHD